jgi:hypothetical protein
MNERIKQLAIEADIMAPTWNHVPLGYQKFAELIVRECADVGALGQGPTDSELIKRGVLEHFGVEE